MQNYDMLVVGAGPAGSSTAFAAAKAGCRVLMVDKKKVLGQPVQCAEYVPRLLLSKCSISKDSIVQNIASMMTHLPNGGTIETKSPGFMLDRSIFDNELAGNARDAGVEILSDTTCLARKGGKVMLKQGQTNIEIIPSLIVGADGPVSTVGQWMESVNKEFITGLQYTLPLTEPQEHTEVFFQPEFFGGYGWLFPKGDVANVGIGVKMNSKHEKQHPVMNAHNTYQHSLLNAHNTNQHSLRKKLDMFVEQLRDAGMVKNNPVSITGGLIPVGGPLKTVKNDMLLVGDAAGHTDAITGGGIPQAVICGEMAGRIGGRAVLKGEIDLLNEYEVEWRGFFGQNLENAVEKREILESHWDELDEI
ncbi:MAG: NAD(P)/FAD-dependent oxidoreductase, partial [Candidatus Thermoplasmatota archaeon]|nr:NAD(P)/FAD-dependent oxidoreductase [Candidatus Thermoplasmatota archaeon]